MACDGGEGNTQNLPIHYRVFHGVRQHAVEHAEGRVMSRIHLDGDANATSAEGRDQRDSGVGYGVAMTRSAGGGSCPTTPDDAGTWRVCLVSARSAALTPLSARLGDARAVVSVRIGVAARSLPAPGHQEVG